MIAKINQLLQTPGLKNDWGQRREKMLSEKIDVTAWMVNLVENFI
jgi:predicted glycosyltransferase